MKVNSKMVKSGLATIVKDNPVSEVAEDSATLSTGVVEVKAEVVDDCLHVGNYFMRPSGLWLEVPDPKNKSVIVRGWLSDPFNVVGVAYDAQQNNPHYIITFVVNQYEKEVMLPMEQIYTSKDVARKLSNRGLLIAPGAIDCIPAFFSLMHHNVPHNVELTYSCGWQTKYVFMLPNGESYGDNKELVRPSSELQGSLDEQSKGGTMKGQKEAMKLACNNPWFQFRVSVALAGPLIRLTNSRNVGFHVWSKSSTGKSIGAELVASIWQNPDPLQKWRSTANALEGLALRHNDGFMVLDEIQEVDSAETLDEASYMLANGKQKARCNADGTLKKIGSWNVAYFSTGEYDYATALRKKSGNRIQQAQSGQEVRLINIHAPETSMGMVSDFATYGFGNSEEYVLKVQALARANYGYLAGAYVEVLAQELQKDPEGFSAQCSQSKEDWKATVPSGSNQVNRIRDSFALVACAGKLATDKGIVPWGENDAFEACRMVYEAFLEDRGSDIDGEDLKILKVILTTVQAHSHRFATGQALNLVRDCLGRLVMTPDSQEILFYDFTSEGLQEICRCKIDRILDALKSQEWLVPNDKGENQHKTTVKKEQWRFYRISHDKVREFEDSLNRFDSEAEVEAEADAVEGQDG